jgi:hypothetical protein
MMMKKIDRLQFSIDMDSIQCIHALRDGFNDMVDVVNVHIDDRNKRVRGDAMTLLLNMVQNPQTRLQLAAAHATPDGEDILIYLIEQGMVVIVDGHVEPTDAGRDQVSMLGEFLQDQVPGHDPVNDPPSFDTVCQVCGNVLTEEESLSLPFDGGVPVHVLCNTCRGGD